MRGIYGVVRYYKFVHIENIGNKDNKAPPSIESVYIKVNFSCPFVWIARSQRLLELAPSKFRDNNKEYILDECESEFWNLNTNLFSLVNQLRMSWTFFLHLFRCF